MILCQKRLMVYCTVAQVTFLFATGEWVIHDNRGSAEMNTEPFLIVSLLEGLAVIIMMLLCFSMLHDDPSRRIPAEMALCSPFFSIPFGKLYLPLFPLPGYLVIVCIYSQAPYLINSSFITFAHIVTNFHSPSYWRSGDASNSSAQTPQRAGRWLSWKWRWIWRLVLPRLYYSVSFLHIDYDQCVCDTNFIHKILIFLNTKFKRTIELFDI